MGSLGIVGKPHRADIAAIRTSLWSLYADLKAYKKASTQTASYTLLNALLKRIHHNKSEWLLVLERAEIPLHTMAVKPTLEITLKKR